MCLDDVIMEDEIKLLVVDDDDVDRERIRRMIASSNIDVNINEANSAQDSIEFLTNFDYDCVIVDYRLGAVDGLSLLSEIRKNMGKQCAVIMITGLGDEKVAAEAMRLGASDYLVKSQLKSPLLLNAILSAVNRSKLEKKLHKLAHYDSLTGVVSRHLLIDRLNLAISGFNPDQLLSAVAFIDLDNFKPINDSYGHEAGDLVLKEVASRISMVLNSQDTVARVGGDEFALILNKVNTQEEAEIILKRVLIILSAPFDVNNEQYLRISASIGAVFIDQNAVDPETLLRRADQSMYLAKNSGRNKVVFFDLDEEHKLQHCREVMKEVELGINNNEFLLHYQPKIDLITKEIIGVEALIRWQNPQQGLLYPNSFFEALDHSTLGVTIGEWVLKTAIQQQSEWRKQNIKLKVSINISAHHLLHYDFIDSLRALIESMPNVNPELIELEVLETVSIRDVDAAINTLNRCREFGISIALDDFGTGYSSLSYLKQLPLDVVKIDQSFVKNILENEVDKVIIESVVNLSNVLGYRIVAEGVESKAHEEALINMGCHFGQGYYIAKPMTSDDIFRWIVSHNKSLPSR